jgi:leader peptidase (prepilin peptidase)/N-methyltransferase
MDFILIVLNQSPLLFATLTGLIVGSFISMLSWRLPRMLEKSGQYQWHKISTSRSECPSCNKVIPWYRLIPLLSWLISLGKCSSCSSSISIRYPLIELATLIITLFIVWHANEINSLTIFLLIFAWFLITISVVDIEHLLILDNLSLPLLWIGLAINSQAVFVEPQLAIWGAIVGYGLLWLVFISFKFITNKEALGQGDFKLLAALGAWTGIVAIPQIIFLAAIMSIFISLILAVLIKRPINQPMPFGPFLAFGALFSLILGSRFIEEYYYTFLLILI